MTVPRRLLIASFAALSLTVAHAPSRVVGVEPDGMGSAKGSVTDAKGAPVAACVIQVFTGGNFGGHDAVKGGKKGKTAGAITIGGQDPHLLQAKGTPVTSATTDASGNFEIKSIKAGEYRYIAGNRTTGRAGGAFKVEAGKATDIQIKLADPAPAH